MSREELVKQFKLKCSGNSQTTMNEILANQCADIVEESNRGMSCGFIDWARKTCFMSSGFTWEYKGNNYTTDQLYDLYLSQLNK